MFFHQYFPLKTFVQYHSVFFFSMISISVSCSIVPMSRYLFKRSPPGGYFGYFQHLAIPCGAAPERPQKCSFSDICACQLTYPPKHLVTCCLHWWRGRMVGKTTGTGETLLGHEGVAGEVVRPGTAFFKVQKENRMGFGLLRFPLLLAQNSCQ